ncbi:LOG family protein [Candidatus Geothermarchaeota archaeon]|nr:MAG: LOG family protein [Candidatus Geothermarchaeota archaeon]
MKYIGVAAYSGEVKDIHKEKIRVLIDTLSKECDVEDAILLLGGYWGLMKYIVDYSISKGFKVVLFPPLEREDVKFPSRCIVIRSGSSYRIRSNMLVRSSDILIAAGGGGGTINEIVIAYLEGKNVYVLKNMGLPSDKMELLGNYLDNRRTSVIKYYDRPEELAREVCLDISPL